MKPSWKDAPHWAQFLAMDADGAWWWYQNEPTRRLGQFSTHLSGGLACSVSPIAGWDQSIEGRPDET